MEKSRLTRKIKFMEIIIVLAVAGWIASRGIPVTRIFDPVLTIRWNILGQTLQTIGYARRERSVFLSILGISWFWLLGAAYLTQLPNFTRQVLRGDEGG